MESINAVQALTALAHDTRLTVFRMLVRAGPDGLAVGVIGETLGLPAPSLSFHLKELSIAHLVKVRRAGRFLHYSADFTTMNGLLAYLTENCCEMSQCDSSDNERCGPGCDPIVKKSTVSKTPTAKTVVKKTSNTKTKAAKKVAAKKPTVKAKR